MPPIIEVKNLGKKYNITHQRGRYIALRDVLMNIFKNPFKFAKHKAKQIAGMETKEEFWALKNVNFEVQPGEVIGVIGSNGAGKSTLLKILSEITPPTTGEIKINGTIGSLLEVGTGFHPELSGRENIMLNGAILGMTKKEIAKKFDKIVEFAGIEKFLDTPVKYYSSGMYVRLAFSVAAHMEPDILLIDEVLAVGDAEFQKKCLGKMEEITKSEGKTILFVSHNINAVQKLCNRCILLRSGEIIKSGPTKEVTDYYLNKEISLSSAIEYTPNINAEAQITQISILNKNKKPAARLPINDGFYVVIKYEVFREMKNAMLSVMFSHEGNFILNTSSADKEAKLETYAPGKYTTTIAIPPSLFNVGYYSMRISLQRPRVEMIDLKKNIPFEIIDVDNPRGLIYNNAIMGVIAIPLIYETQKY
ncbi:MAG: ABC transporter ATP-binding protein [Patescibacteria group bacterium]|jgi:lipopolysaccharide transport system ATP-binding protein